MFANQGETCEGISGALSLPAPSLDCISVFLANATEIQHDGLGNDNTLCESNEACLFTPNIGSYQGHGNLISAGPFVDSTNGGLTGITLYQYETNGY